MKKYIQMGWYVLALVVLAVVLGFTFRGNLNNGLINGGYKLQNGSVEQVLIFNDGYFMHTTFDKSKKQLIRTRGGAYQFANGQVDATIEFSPQNKDEIGTTKRYVFSVKKDRLNSDISGKKEVWTVLDNGKGEMVGTWRHSGRVQDGKASITPPRARKTLKILSGTRYQWAAINPETKEFFGTGGGSYTFADGKYTETLEFFTKDSTKVGVSLTFDGRIEGDLWHHSGLSSQGAKMHELWRMEPK
jgi:hypothetical protein